MKLCTTYDDLMEAVFKKDDRKGRTLRKGHRAAHHTDPHFNPSTGLPGQKVHSTHVLQNWDWALLGRVVTGEED